MEVPTFILKQATGEVLTLVITLWLAGQAKLACNVLIDHSYRGRNGQENNPLGACAQGY